MVRRRSQPLVSLLDRRPQMPLSGRLTAERHRNVDTPSREVRSGGGSNLGCGVPTALNGDGAHLNADAAQTAATFRQPVRRAPSPPPRCPPLATVSSTNTTGVFGSNCSTSHAAARTRQPASRSPCSLRAADFTALIETHVSH